MKEISSVDFPQHGEVSFFMVRLYVRSNVRKGRSSDLCIVIAPLYFGNVKPLVSAEFAVNTHSVPKEG
jgi:hypothetical protein